MIDLSKAPDPVDFAKIQSFRGVSVLLRSPANGICYSIVAPDKESLRAVCEQHGLKHLEFDKLDKVIIVDGGGKA